MKLIIRLSPTAQTRCATCKADIKKGEIRADVHKFMAGIDYYHLACYTHKGLTPLHSEKIVGKNVKEDRDKATIKEWIDAWNRQFSAKEEEVPLQFLQKTVVTTSTPLRRLLLEVFQYLSMSEIEAKVALSCKDWFHVSRDDEFWRSRVISDFNPAETEAQGNYRRKYIAYWQGACWKCKVIPSLDNVFFKCPYFKRPLCKACASFRDMKIYSFSRYSDEMRFSYARMQELHICNFQYRRAMSSYLYMILEKVVPYVEEQKAKLIQEIQTLGLSTEKILKLINEVESFVSEEYYIGDTRKRGARNYALPEFLGAKRKEERWSREVARLIEKL